MLSVIPQQQNSAMRVAWPQSMANIVLPTFGFRLTQPIAQADTFQPIPPADLNDELPFDSLIND